MRKSIRGGVFVAQAQVLPPLSNLDVDSGKCFLPLRAFADLDIKCNEIVQISYATKTAQMHSYCSAWPLSVSLADYTGQNDNSFDVHLADKQSLSTPSKLSGEGVSVSPHTPLPIYSPHTPRSSPNLFSPSPHRFSTPLSASSSSSPSPANQSSSSMHFVRFDPLVSVKHFSSGLVFDPYSPLQTVHVSKIRKMESAYKIALRVEPGVNVSLDVLRVLLKGLVVSVGSRIALSAHSYVEVTKTFPQNVGPLQCSLATNYVFEAEEDTSQTMESPAISMLTKLLQLMMCPPPSLQAIGPPRHLLLHGPPGVGKTWAVNTAVRRLGMKMIIVDVPSLAGAFVGDSEIKLKQVFVSARATGAPCVIFIDEIDVLCGKREETGSGSRLVTQLLTLMDGIETAATDQVFVVGATNLPNEVDPALRRPGRFDRELYLPPPDPSARLSILKHYTESMPLDESVDLSAVADRSIGFVGADLEALVREAALIAVRDSILTSLDSSPSVPSSPIVKQLETASSSFCCAPSSASIFSTSRSPAVSSHTSSSAPRSCSTSSSLSHSASAFSASSSSISKSASSPFTPSTISVSSSLLPPVRSCPSVTSLVSATVVSATPSSSSVTMHLSSPSASSPTSSSSTSASFSAFSSASSSIFSSSVNTETNLLLDDFFASLSLSSSSSSPAPAPLSSSFVSTSSIASSNSSNEDSIPVSLSYPSSSPSSAPPSSSIKSKIRKEHFDQAFRLCKSSSLRSATKPGSVVTWADIGGLAAVKQKFQQAIEWPRAHPHTWARLGLSPPRGVLLYGPPGCGKTRLVRALAHSSQYAFVSINGAELYSCYVGEAEKNLRELFARARSNTPCILFLDELDSMVTHRSESGSAVEDRILSTLLNEMDGIQAASNILIVGATNRLDEIDAALTRPGRFDVVIEVPLPDYEARLSILCLQRTPVNPEVDLGLVATRLEGCSGADVENVMREAAIATIRTGADEVGQFHINEALKLVRRPNQNAL